MPGCFLRSKTVLLAAAAALSAFAAAGHATTSSSVAPLHSGSPRAARRALTAAAPPPPPLQPQDSSTTSLQNAPSPLPLDAYVRPASDPQLDPDIADQQQQDQQDPPAPLLNNTNNLASPITIISPQSPSTNATAPQLVPRCGVSDPRAATVISNEMALRTGAPDVSSKFSLVIRVVFHCLVDPTRQTIGRIEAPAIQAQVR